jgi:hypothetical protein
VIQYATVIQAAGAQTGAADTEEARRAVKAVIAVVAASLEESVTGSGRGPARLPPGRR